MMCRYKMKLTGAKADLAIPELVRNRIRRVESRAKSRDTRARTKDKRNKEAMVETG
jgi:hypothetical protein